MHFYEAHPVLIRATGYRFKIVVEENITNFFFLERIFEKYINCGARNRSADIQGVRKSNVKNEHLYRGGRNSYCTSYIFVLRGFKVRS